MMNESSENASYPIIDTPEKELLNFADLVSRMRKAQKDYFREPRGKQKIQLWFAAMKLEDVVDHQIKRIQSRYQPLDSSSTSVV